MHQPIGGVYIRVYTSTILRKDKLPQVYQKCQADPVWPSGHPWNYRNVDCVFGGSPVTVSRGGSTVSSALIA